MVMVKHGAYQQQRGGSLDRGQALEHPEAHQSRHRRPMPLPLAARHQASFLRSRQPQDSTTASNSHDEDDGRRSNIEHYPSGFSYENHFNSFPHFQQQQHHQQQPQHHQPTLVNNYVFPSVDNTFSTSFNNATMVNDSNVTDVDAPSFATNDTNDVDDDLDDKPTDYSLRFQESEEPEYLAAAPANVPPPPSSPPAVNNVIVDIDDEDDLCVDAVKSYCIEATPFDTPGPISEATSVNDLRVISDQVNIHHDDDDDDDEVIFSFLICKVRPKY